MFANYVDSILCVIGIYVIILNYVIVCLILISAFFIILINRTNMANHSQHVKCVYKMNIINGILNFFLSFSSHLSKAYSNKVVVHFCIGSFTEKRATGITYLSVIKQKIVL